MRILFALLLLNAASWAEPVNFIPVPKQISFGLYDPVRPSRLCIPSEVKLIPDEHYIQIGEREAINLVSQIDVEDGACHDIVDIKNSDDHGASVFTESTVRQCPNKAAVSQERRVWKIEPGHISLDSKDLVNPSGSYSCEWRLRQ